MTEAPRVMAGAVVTGGNLEGRAGSISLAFNRLKSVCPGPGTQPDLPAKLCVSGPFPPGGKEVIQRGTGSGTGGDKT